MSVNIWCVRADYGRYAESFLKGNYTAIGWLSSVDLQSVGTREELYALYKKEYPKETNLVVGQQVGQISRFLHEIRVGDYIILPTANTDHIQIGVVAGDYYFDPSHDRCPFNHRRKVQWYKKPIQRSQFSVPFQNTIRSSLTVFAVSHKKNFFTTIGKPELLPEEERNQPFDYYTSVLNRILELNDVEFEILITHLLTALGFEGAEHTGKVGDGGVDATGELNVANLAKIKLIVQVKRYKIESKISAKTVKELRSNIPAGGQGALITTAGFRTNAKEIALESGFPRIGLIDGNQLVDILAEHWEDIPQEFQDKLELKTGLVVR